MKILLAIAAVIVAIVAVLGVIAPTNEPVWGLYYRFLPDVGVPAQIKRVTVGALWQIGLRPRYTTMHSGIYSTSVQDPLGTTNENSAAADPSRDRIMAGQNH